MNMKAECTCDCAGRHIVVGRQLGHTDVSIALDIYVYTLPRWQKQPA